MRRIHVVDLSTVENETLFLESGTRRSLRFEIELELRGPANTSENPWELKSIRAGDTRAPCLGADVVVLESA